MKARIDMSQEEGVAEMRRIYGLVAQRGKAIADCHGDYGALDEDTAVTALIGHDIVLDNLLTNIVKLNASPEVTQMTAMRVVAEVVFDLRDRLRREKEETVRLNQMWDTPTDPDND